MRIMLNKILPSAEELALLAAMGIDVSKIEDQYNRGHYHRGNYFVETSDPAFTERVENKGIGRSKKTISFYGVDVMYVCEYSLFNESSIKFKLDVEGVERALANAFKWMTVTSWQIESKDTGSAPKADRLQAF